MTVRMLIGALERFEPATSLMFDFCGLEPTTLDSYRGYYEDLALGWRPREGEGVTTASVLASLRAAIGATFQGWKGGDYVAHLDSRVWVANRGESGGTGIVGVENGEWRAVLQTALVD
jgi:hypothetical protein